MVNRLLVLVYGTGCYAVFFATFLYAAGFVTGFGVPKTIDSGNTTPFATALAIDAVLLSVFALQHSIMARAWFKRAWTQVVPKAAERSTYVLFASLALALLFWQWRPIGGTVWSVDSPAGRLAIMAVGICGWLTVLASTFAIDHFELFGVRQVWLNLVGRKHTEPEFRTPLMYRYVRHPLYLGFIMAFWGTPSMSATHLFFAVMTTAYILVAIRFEESDLILMHGERYRKYKHEVPMLLPVRIGDAAVSREENAVYNRPHNPQFLDTAE